MSNHKNKNKTLNDQKMQNRILSNPAPLRYILVCLIKKTNFKYI